MFAQILISSILNALATAGSPAALAYTDSIMAVYGVVSASHYKGDQYALDQCKNRTTFDAEVSGASRLSTTVVVDGSVRYRRISETYRTGTAFVVNDELRPFDIVLDNPGDNNTEAIELSAGAGWRIANHASIGARASYATADRARTKDLRHANSLMDLNTSAGLCYAHSHFTMAANILYRRTVESIAFSRAGTTDIVYTPLIDYGNGLGISESYNGTGFTNDTRQPLLSEYVGASAQVEMHPAKSLRIFAHGSYAHRKGHYGRDSQYTIIHDKFSGNSWNTILAVQCGQNIVEASCKIDALVNYRTNYLSQLVDGVTYYKYYQPTKTASKMRIMAELAYIVDFMQIDAEMYRWRVKAGCGLCRNLVTAWLYPLSTKTDCNLYRPFAAIEGKFPVRKNAMFIAELGSAYQFATGNFIPDYNLYTKRGLDVSATLHYIFSPIKTFGLRPGFFAKVHTQHQYLEGGISISI